MAIIYDTNWKREYSLCYGSVIIRTLKEWIKQETGKEVATRGEGINGWFRSCSESPYIQKAKDILLSKIKRNPLYLREEIDLIKKRGEEFVNFTKNIKISSKTDKEELTHLYKKYLESLYNYCLALWISFNLVEMTSIVFEDFLKKNVEKEKRAEAIKYYSHPSQKAAIFIIQDYFKKEKSGEKRASFIKDKFPWIFSTDPALDIDLDKEISAFISSFSAVSLESEATSDFPIKDNQIIKMYQDALYIKDKRDDYRREGFYLGLPLMHALSKKLDISIAELGFLLPEEILSSNYKELIKQRKIGYIIDFSNNNLIIKSGEKVKSDFIPEVKDNDNSSIKGTIGCHGIAKGIVQILIKREDIKSFKEGNILVSITTNPEHMPAMQKASAFITDEGGITCHAAIVARELNKPCIIGTKIATRVLKDGDMVEVDADKGIVKIIKKAE